MGRADGRVGGSLESTSPRWISDAAWALFAALSVAVGALAVDIQVRAPGLEDPLTVATATAATALHTLALIVCLWAFLRPLTARWAPTPEAAVLGISSAIACYVAVAAMFRLLFPVTVFDWETLASLDYEPRRWFASAAALSAIVGVLVFITADRLLPRRVLPWAPTVLMLMIAGTAGGWWIVYGGGLALLVLAAAPISGIFLARHSTSRTALTGLSVCMAVLLVVGAFGVYAVYFPSPANAVIGGDPKQPNVVLITFDTLRADSVLGPVDRRPTTPNFDAFASESAVFSNAISAGGWTAPGLTSLLTGVSPDLHGLTIEPLPLRDDTLTIADRLAEIGYRTTAVGMNPVVTTSGSAERFESGAWRPPPVIGFSPGARALHRVFSRFSWNVHRDELTHDALRWIDDAPDEPFLLWLHYFDPHGPYDPPRRLVDESLYEPRIGWEISHESIQLLRFGTEGWRLNERERAWVRELYDAEVTLIDEHLGRVLDALRERGLYDESWVILGSDHGEEFFEHNNFAHGQSLYNELVHVPLMIKRPGPPAPARIDSYVASAALTPTLVDYLGGEYRREDYSDASLRPWLDAAPEAAEEPIFLSGVRFQENWHGVVFDGFKYLRRDVSGAEELYDLRVDPGETENLADPERIERARTLLGDYLEDVAARRPAGATDGQQVDSATRTILESLGYIQ